MSEYTAKEVCEAYGIDTKPGKMPTSDDIGATIRDAIEGLPIAFYDEEGDVIENQSDEIEQIDASDWSNLEIFTATGARFVVRIVRKG